MEKQLLAEIKRTNELLKLLSDQLELQYLQQFVNESDKNPNPVRLLERNEIRSAVFAKRQELGLED